MIGLEWLWLSLKQRKKPGINHHRHHFGKIISIAVRLFNFLIGLDYSPLLLVLPGQFSIEFSIVSQRNGVSKNNNVQFGSNNQPMSSKILPFLGSMFTFDVFRFKTNNKNRISSSCQIFSKAFLETVGLCGILHLKPSQNLQQ